MRYLTAGSGPPLIFIAGLLGFSFSWTENLEFFSQHFTVYAPDLFGTGYSDPPPTTDCSLGSIARQVLEFMDSVEIGRATLIGSSHGATLTFLVAASAPERVERIVPCAPAHPWSGEAKRISVRIFASPLGPLLARWLRFVPKVFRRVALFKVYKHPSRAPLGTISGYAEPMLKPASTDYLLSVLRCWKKDFADLAEKIKEVHCPVLLVWGKDDYVIPLRTAAELCSHLQCAQLTVIPDCGHLPYEELPHEFNQRVLEWLLRPASELC